MTADRPVSGPWHRDPILGNPNSEIRALKAALTSSIPIHITTGVPVLLSSFPEQGV